MPQGSSTTAPRRADASLASLAKRIRMTVLHQSKRAGVGHIGSALSVADIIAVLYGEVMRVSDPADSDRDRFVLSKGHAALALYAALHERGWLDAEILSSYCGDRTLAGTHPDHRLPGIDFSTGSLGQGLAFGAGAALAARLLKSDRRVFVLVSDAECNEGSLWESVMFAAQHQLSNLVAIIDANGQQALDHTERVLDLSPIDRRWAAFGWRTLAVDGHDLEQLATALADAASPADAGRATPVEGPLVVVARTVFGRGVSFMEGQVKWHYLPMNDDEYREAVAQVER